MLAYVLVWFVNMSSHTTSGSAQFASHKACALAAEQVVEAAHRINRFMDVETLCAPTSMPDLHITTPTPDILVK